MKRIISLLIFISVICGAFFFIQQEVGADTTYYTKITNKGKKIIEKTNRGESITDYEYTLKAADDQGNVKNISFKGNRDRPLKMYAYLKVGYNAKKGVINWEEVQQKDVPAKALAKIK